jgi:hypothetical protein
MVPKHGSEDNRILTMTMNNDMELDPYLLFINAIMSVQTQIKYKARLNIFFDFISLPDGPLNERCEIFIKNCQENPQYPLNCAFRFVIFQKERMESHFFPSFKIFSRINYDVKMIWRK